MFLEILVINLCNENSFALIKIESHIKCKTDSDALLIQNVNTF